MSTTRTGWIEDAARARSALTPLRRQLLELLREPGSAASLAVRLGMSRQKIGYHLRALEAAGLLRVESQRARRGFTERLLMAEADAFIIDPAILGAPGVDADEKQDRHAAGHLVALAAGTVREVTRMQAAARAEEKRLLTFAIEAEMRFAAPGDIERFTTRLAAMVATLAAEFAPAQGGRRYRLLIGGHPASKDRAETPIN